MESKIFFADQNIKKAFEKLSKLNEKELYNSIIKSLTSLEKNAFCGTQIQKNLIPKTYIKKYKIDNLWKINLPNAWRLIYSVSNNNIVVISIILEWMSHKEYERKFKY